MIAANETVARRMIRLGLPCIYRIHEEPDTGKIENVLRYIPVSRKKSKPATPDMLHKVLRDVKGGPEEEIITYMILRSLKQARYSDDNVGHFGLASDCYCHFTSPIRRYPDLVCHRILKETLLRKKLSEKRLGELQALLTDISFHSSRMERQATDAEREIVGAMRVWFMKERVGEEFAGRITGVTPDGIRVRLDEYYIDGFIRVSQMDDDFYRYDERSITLKGRHSGRTFRLGLALAVRVDRVDVEEREVVFGIISEG